MEDDGDGVKGGHEEVVDGCEEDYGSGELVGVDAKDGAGVEGKNGCGEE